MSNKDIKRATIGRLPQYLRYITALPQEITTVSATGIDHQPRHAAVDDEARVVASRHEGASRAEYGDSLCH